MTYNALMLALERGGSSNATDRELLEGLQRLAVEALHPDANEAAVSSYLSVQDAIARLREKKIRDQKQRQRRAGRRAARKERLKPTREHAARLVRMKARQLGIGHLRTREDRAMRRMQEETPIDETRRDVQLGKLSPAEERAVEIVCGARIKAKKNRIESKAIKIADAVKGEWFADQAARPRGRPKGSMINIADRDQLPSVTEVIAAVGPTIQELARGAASTAPRSAMIAAVVAAVEAAGLHCTIDLALDLVPRLRRAQR